MNGSSSRRSISAIASLPQPSSGARAAGAGRSTPSAGVAWAEPAPRGGAGCGAAGRPAPIDSSAPTIRRNTLAAPRRARWRDERPAARLQALPGLRRGRPRRGAALPLLRLLVRAARPHAVGARGALPPPGRGDCERRAAAGRLGDRARAGRGAREHDLLPARRGGRLPRGHRPAGPLPHRAPPALPARGRPRPGQRLGASRAVRALARRARRGRPAGRAERLRLARRAGGGGPPAGRGAAVSRADEMAALLLELVAIPTENPPGRRLGECAAPLPDAAAIQAFAYGPGRLEVSHGPDEHAEEAAMSRC